MVKIKSFTVVLTDKYDEVVNITAVGLNAHLTNVTIRAEDIKDGDVIVLDGKDRKKESKEEMNA